MTGSGSGSIMVRRQLGRRLRKLRDDAGKTMRSVQDARLFSESKVARLEAGKMPVRVGDVWTLCRFYGASPEETDALAALAEGTTQDGWWEDNPSIVPEWFGLYIGLESSCNVLSSWHPELIHGLLQTTDFARAVIQTDQPTDPEVVEARLKLRLERQQAVLDDRSRQITAILGPGALELVIGSPQVMAEQVAQLRDLSERSNIDVHILPGGAGAHPGLSGPFMLMDFADPDDTSVVYLESLTGARYLEQPRQVTDYRRAFSTLYAMSVPIKEYTE